MAAREDVYTYGDTNWKDKLTAYDGKPITYDAIGNPLTYDGYIFTWQADLSAAGGGYSAKEDGARNEQCERQCSSATIEQPGWPAIVKFNNDYYAYGCNLQGDVVSLTIHITLFHRDNVLPG